jgi:N-acyl-L-homoserine lactone synthetase
MILVIQPRDADKHPKLMEDMYRLRARVFFDKLKWDVQVVDGMERDEYDGESPVYIILTDSNAQTVHGSLRILPTTGPTLLANIFLDTLPDAVYLSSPAIWECTRLCIDDKVVGDRPEAMLLASGILLEALGEVALKAGIETILGVFDPVMLRVYRRIGCEVEVLGCTRRFARPVYLGSFRVSEQILERIKSRRLKSGVLDAASLVDHDLAA